MNHKSDIKDLIKIIKKHDSLVKNTEERKSTVETLYSVGLYCFHKKMLSRFCTSFLIEHIARLHDPLLSSLFKQAEIEFSPPHNDLMIVRFVIPRELQFFEDIFHLPIISELIQSMFDESYTLQIKTSFKE